MRLTVYADCSLRVLMVHAVKGDTLATIAEIVKSHGVIGKCSQSH